MKKVLEFLCLVIFLISGCGQSYIGKTATYYNGGSDQFATLWYEVPQKWDCVDKLDDSVFIPDANAEVHVWYGGGGDYDSYLNNIISYNENDANESRIWEHYEELTINGNKAIKATFRNKTAYSYKILVDLSYHGVVLIYANELAYSKNPYEKEMDHIAETIKAI